MYVEQWVVATLSHLLKVVNMTERGGCTSLTANWKVSAL